MRTMKSQQGFTLIELIVVIVILGILAVSAAPKFISFTSDAGISAVKGVKGGISGAMTMMNAKAAIDGNDTSGDTTVSTIEMAFGYPKATAGGIITAASLSAATADKNSDLVYNISGTVMVLAPSSKVSATLTTDATDVQVKAANCYVTYTQATAATIAGAATVAYTTSGC